jgi:hypothetical protein
MMFKLLEMSFLLQLLRLLSVGIVMILFMPYLIVRSLLTRHIFSQTRKPDRRQSKMLQRTRVAQFQPPHHLQLFLLLLHLAQGIGVLLLLRRIISVLSVAN